jgi:ABC-type antimicrobial peptide transport system permease subunit
MALGAMRSSVAALVMKDMLALVMTGVLLALPGIWLLTRVLRTFLYDMTPADPVAIVSAIGMLFAAACAAVWVPSRRALRVNPTAALREE